MFQSPLKTVTEKIKPTQSKSGISSLKFERASDFKKFIGFIKTETEELEKIKLPKIAEVKPKSKSVGLLGLLGLGLLGGLGAAFGGGEGNERTGSEGGTASEFNTGILLTKNIRKTQKNLGLTKSVKKGKSEYKKIKNMFKKTFPKPDKKTLLKMKETRKNSRLRIRRFNKTIKDITKELNEAQYAKTELLKKGYGLDDPFVQIYDDEIRKLKNFQKKALMMRDFEELKIEANKPVGSFSTEKLKITRQILDDANVSFIKEGKGKFKAIFGEGFEVTDRKFIETILRENPNAAEFFKKIKGLDPLLFDVPQGGTLFSKILGKDTGIKIENKMGIVRESLDDAFTTIGKTTKPLRNFFAPAAKNLGKTKIPFTKIKLTSLSGLKGIFLPLDLINLAASFNELGLVDFSDGILKPKVGRDNIFTSVYDMFTVFYNAGVEGLGFDDAHKRLKISKPKDKEISGSLIPFTNIGAYKINPRRIVDTYNEEILEARKNKKLRDIFNASNFDTSMLNNPNIQFPKSNVFAIQKPNGADFAVPYEYSEGLYDFTMPLKIKLNKQ